MKRLTVLGLIATAVVGAAGVTPVAVGASTNAASISWSTCDDPGLQDAGAQCAMLSVPLDYSEPNGTQIQLAVSRVLHTVPDSQAQGVMLINAGGPGVPGVGLATLGQAVPNGAGGYYDWIGFDPRGVGASQPSLSCDPNYFDFNRPSYVPLQTSTLNQWLARSKGYADACKANGPILSHMTTIENARDIDSIRAALGVEQINYYGCSYGTYLGQVYSTIIKIWFGWLAKYDSAYHLGKTEKAVEALFYQTEAKLTLHPADGKIGGDEWVDIFLPTGYSQATWTLLGDAFSRFIHNDDVANLEDLFLIIDGLGNDNFYAVYNAVQCTDVQWPQQWSRWSRDNWATFAKAPFETWANAWYNAPCLYWPAPAHKPLTIDGSNVSSALLIDQTLDAPTPYEGSLEVRQLYPNSSLIALPGGTTHGSSLSGDACLDDQVAAYLANGTLPPRKPGKGADTTCAPPPVPVPDAATAT